MGTRDSSNISDNSITKTRRQRIAEALTAHGIVERIEDRLPELTENAKVVLERRYLSKDRSGTILEDVDGMFRRVARNLSEADLNYGASEAERQAAPQLLLVGQGVQLREVLVALQHRSVVGARGLAHQRRRRRAP